MSLQKHTADVAAWQQFVIDNGWRASAYEIAAVTGQSAEEIERFRRQSRACTQLPKGKRFAELFALWHGRPPEDSEWPLPRKTKKRAAYEWHGPELALLASLVGRLGAAEISRILTKRLRKQTGDRAAERSPIAVQVRINQIGMQTSKDVVGGITTTEAGREIGSKALIYQAIDKKQLRTSFVGRIRVIPYDAWEAWKAKRVFPPKGYVQLSTIRDALAIKSDKLSEFARMGYVPTSIRCNPYGTKCRSSKFGTWYIDPKVAAALLADRRAGRPMPWHGKPMADNLRVTFKLWQLRQHPASCKICAAIWGKQGAPKSYEDYEVRYPPIAHGAKRHLTRPWNPGLTISEVAAHTGHSRSRVIRAIENGMLEASFEGRCRYVSRTDATRWRARKCPTGEGEKSWISLGTAQQQYLFTRAELRRFIAEKKLKSKIGTDGTMRGREYVSRHQCGQLREKIGFTEEEVARRVGVSIPRLQVLLEGVNWRKIKGKGGIPLVTVQAVIKRLESRAGYTFEEAAAALGKPVQWVMERKQDGTIRVTRAKWNRRRTYITQPMFERLEAALKKPVKRERFNDDWLLLSEAGHEAGVSIGTIIKWAEKDELARRQSKVGWRYHRDAVRARARLYWKSVRFHRAIPPAWLQAESDGQEQEPVRAASTRRKRISVKKILLTPATRRMHATGVQANG